MTYEEIWEAIERAVKQSGSMRDYVKSVINMVYINEIAEADDLYPLFWLRKMDDTLATKAAATITGITAANPPVVTATAHGLVAADLVSIYSVSGMTEVNNRVFRVTDVTANTFELQTPEGTDVDGSGYTAYSSGGSAVHRGLTLATSGIDVESILQAGFHGYKPMKRITPEELEETTKWWDLNTSRPERWLHKKLYSAAGVETNQMWFFPAADAAYDLRYWARTRLARLSVEADTPLLPLQFHDTIIAGAITRLIESQVQVENAVIWPGLYRQQLDNLRTYNRKFYETDQGIGYLV